MPTGNRRVTRSTLTPKAELGDGFTLIELLVVLVIIALLASIVMPRYLDRVDDARETALRGNLVGLRTNIDLFYRDKNRYPANLNELVVERYIRAVPEDPMTSSSDTWRIVTPPGSTENVVFDVKSGSLSRAKDGRSYSDW